MVEISSLSFRRGYLAGSLQMWCLFHHLSVCIGFDLHLLATQYVANFPLLGHDRLFIESWFPQFASANPYPEKGRLAAEFTLVTDKGRCVTVTPSFTFAFWRRRIRVPFMPSWMSGNFNSLMRQLNAFIGWLTKMNCVGWFAIPASKQLHKYCALRNVRSMWQSR